MLIAPSSQELEPPEIPGRFIRRSQGLQQSVERVMPLLKFELIASDEGQARQMPDQQIVAI
ncbi:hypothetical protein, partial [Xanthomonas fragariae]|uniref:hypothetical protein n=1 Tax=Xanthomonas fragariae TaxID=48664 RepID=UPI00353123A2